MRAAATKALREVSRLVLYCGALDRVAGFNRDLASKLRGANLEHVQRPGGHTFRLLHQVTPHLLGRASAALNP